MSMLSEFKSFAVRGNVVDMAVGVVIGAAFGKIVSSFVADVITPLMGVLVGGVDVSDAGIELRAAQGEVPAIVLAYGKVVQASIDFVIVAFAIFMVVRSMNRFMKKEEAAPPPPPEPTREEVLLTEIRDALRRP